MTSNVSMSESDGIPNESDDNLVTAEGVNERGTNAEAAGSRPGTPAQSVEVPLASAEVNDPPSERGDHGAGDVDPRDVDRGDVAEDASAPGLAVGDDHGAMDPAPEPNEPG